MSYEEKPVLTDVSKEIEKIVLGYGFEWTHGVRNRNVYKHESGSVTISCGGVSFSCTNYKYTPRSVYARGTYVLTEKEASSIERKLNMMKKKTEEMKDKETQRLSIIAGKKKEWEKVLDTINLEGFSYEIKECGYESYNVYVKITYNNHTLKVFDKDTLEVYVAVGEESFMVHVEKAFKLIELLKG